MALFGKSFIGCVLLAQWSSVSLVNTLPTEDGWASDLSTAISNHPAPAPAEISKLDGASPLQASEAAFEQSSSRVTICVSEILCSRVIAVQSGCD
jgi:hypothetical protein